MRGSTPLLRAIDSNGQVIDAEDYRNKGALEVRPFTQLDKGAMSGPDQECIEIMRLVL